MFAEIKLPETGDQIMYPCPLLKMISCVSMVFLLWRLVFACKIEANSDWYDRVDIYMLF